MGKHFVLSFILLCSSLLFAIGIGEVILRLLGYRGWPGTTVTNIYWVEDQVLNWRTIPNSAVEEDGILYAYNSSGFRDIEHELIKARDVQRIVVLGDSVSEGLGVPWPRTFAAMLQAELGDRFEVINIAARALNTPQEIHLLEQEGIKYKPDLILVNFVLNDCDFYSEFKSSDEAAKLNESKIVMLGLRINPQLKRLLKSSALVFFVHQRVKEVQARIFGMEEADYYTKLWANEDNRRRVLQGFDRLAWLKTKEMFRVVVMIWPFITAYDGYKFSYVHDWIKQEVRKRGLESVDLLPDFSKVDHRKLQVYPDDNIHTNPVGYSLAVSAFRKWYLKDGQGSIGCPCVEVDAETA